jgi:cell division protein FtsW (lipid II flippase)
MLLSVGTLVGLGLLSIQAWAGSTEKEGQKQLVFLCFGVAVLFGMQLVNYRRLLRFSLLIYMVTLLPVIYTVIGKFTPVPLSREVNGAHAWIQFGSISVQPSELAKVTLVMFLAWILRHEEQQQNHSPKMLLQVLLFSGVAVGLVMLQPDLGMALTIFCPVAALLWVSGIRKRHLASLVLLGSLAFPVFWFSGTCPKYGQDCTVCSNVPGLRNLPQLLKHYQRVRVYSLFSRDPQVLKEGGFQQERAMLAMGSGGVVGKGSGEIPVSLHVPEAQTDMVLSIIGEQYGLMGVAVVLLAYMLLFGTGIAIAAAHREPVGKLLATALVVLLAGQAMINMGVVLRVFPVTGLTLPFVSYGGSSLVVSFLIVGLLINIARHQRKVIF